MIDPNQQPPPQPNNKPFIKDLVIADMQSRAEMGKRQYGTYLQPHNGRNALQDLYEELLDACAYIRQLIEEKNELSDRGK